MRCQRHNNVYSYFIRRTKKCLDVSFSTQYYFASRVFKRLKMFKKKRKKRNRQTLIHINCFKILDKFIRKCNKIVILSHYCCLYMYLYHCSKLYSCGFLKIILLIKRNKWGWSHPYLFKLKSMIHFFFPLCIQTEIIIETLERETKEILKRGLI